MIAKVILLLGLGVVSGTLSAEPEASAEDVECYLCQDIVNGGSVQHQFSGPQGALFQPVPNVQHSGLLSGTCGAYHNVCIVEEEDQELAAFLLIGGWEEVQQRWVAADYRGLVELTEKYSHVTFNATQRAIQVQDCDGHVVAHFPLAPEVVGLFE